MSWLALNNTKVQGQTDKLDSNRFGAAGRYSMEHPFSCMDHPFRIPTCATPCRCVYCMPTHYFPHHSRNVGLCKTRNRLLRCPLSGSLLLLRSCISLTGTAVTRTPKVFFSTNKVRYRRSTSPSNLKKRPFLLDAVQMRVWTRRVRREWNGF